ncbi:MAG: AMIN domain-containing protein [Candidatus Aminicenantes bacterium]|nr:AMIN domain-containing protein [Candidatus Aminicenantes bacterium]
MKNLIIKSIKILFILVCISCVSYRGTHFVNLTTRELSSETELVITTTEPVQVKDTKLEDPPCLILSFPEDKVYSFEEDELIIDKGPIKRIRNAYYQTGDQKQPQLNLMIVELRQNSDYEISYSGSSIIVRFENSGQYSAGFHEDENNDSESNPEVQPQMKSQDLQTEPGYLIGPGDVLSIEVWQHPDISRDVTVNHKGDIKLPPVRKMNVMGLNAPLLEERLGEALSKYLIDPVVFVTVKEYNSHRVIALGETETGMYTLRRKTSLVEFIGQIGGLSENADVSHIKLIKKDGRIINYDLNELIKDRQETIEAVVKGGDTVYVPPLEFNKVYVLGEVRAPKSVVIKGKLTLIDAIAEAGGYTPDAVTSSVMIVRGELGSQKGIRVNLKRILKEGDIGQNIELEPGDIVYVPKTFVVHIERFLRGISAPILWYLWYSR